jgi:hypothetical protein
VRPGRLSTPAPALRPRRIHRRALLVSTLLGLLLLELGLRLVGFSAPGFYRPDPRRGWSLRPGASGWWRQEGAALVRVNDDGFRGAAVSANKPAGELRIAVLGDSCVEAIQVAEEETFAALLERELAACPTVGGRRVRALNFGVSGYGTAQELLTLREQALRFSPDLVLLGFYAGNDVRNNSPALDQDPARPWLLPAPDGSLRLDDSFRDRRGYRLRTLLADGPVAWASDRSRVLQLVQQGRRLARGVVGAARASRRETRVALQELGLDNAVYSPPADEHWRQAWEVTERLLSAMAAESAAHRSRFAVVSLTTPIQVHPDPAARAAFARRLGVPDLSYPDTRLAGFAAVAGIPFLPLAPTLARVAERDGEPLHGFAGGRPGEGHWNQRGHAAAARAIAPWLCAELSPAPATARGAS